MKKQKQNSLLGIVLSVLIAIMLLFVGVRMFFIDWYNVSGGSMLPTYEHGQLVLGRKVGDPQRFDVVIINAKSLIGQERVIKRVVAFEGEEVWSQDGVLYVSSNGQTMVFENENYGGGDIGKLKVEIKRQVIPQGCVYVLGDNRLTSVDSRTFGPISTDLIEAVVL